jgi:Na+-driven multidrug efflux pump
MAGVQIVIPWFLAIPLAVLLAAWVYRDAKRRWMDTADMWAVGMFIGFFVPPFIGAILVYAFYLRKRNRRRGGPYAVPGR